MSSSKSTLSTGVLLAAAAATCALVGRNLFHKKERTIENSKGHELTALQGFFVDICAKGMDQIVACVEISGNIPSREPLESAVKAVKRLDPNLDYALVKSNDSYALQKTVDVCGSVEVIQDTDWRQVAHDTLNTIQFPKPTIDTPTSTWKVILVRSETSSSSCLMIVLHHAMFDGTSRNRLLGALLKNLMEPTNATAVENAVPEISAVQVVKHTKYMPWWAFVSECISKYKFRQKNRHLPNYYMDLSKAPGILDPHVHRETRQILFQLSQHETNAVILKAKQQNTTVHGALSAAAMLALVPFNTHYKTNTVSTMDLSHLVSLWNSLADCIPPNCLTGCYLNAGRTTCVVNPHEDPWIIAKSVKAQLLTCQPKRMSQYLYTFTYNKFLTRVFGDVAPCEYEKLGRIPFVAISNNGKVDIQNDYGGLRVHGCYASPPRHDIPGNLAVLNVQTVANQMCVAASYYSHVWSDETAEKYVSLFRQILNDMAAS